MFGNFQRGLVGVGFNLSSLLGAILDCQIGGRLKC